MAVFAIMIKKAVTFFLLAINDAGDQLELNDGGDTLEL